MKRLTVSGTTCIEVLGLLVAVAWADGHLEDAEKESVRGAASVLNLSKELRARLDALLEAPKKLDELLLDALSPKDKSFAFVAAAWMAGADSDIAEKERGLLDQLGGILGFPAERQKELETLARDLDPPGKGPRDWSNELVKLFKAIPPRLAEDPIEEAEVVFGDD